MPAHWAEIPASLPGIAMFGSRSTDTGGDRNKKPQEWSIETGEASTETAGECCKKEAIRLQVFSFDFLSPQEGKVAPTANPPTMLRIPKKDPLNRPAPLSTRTASMQNAARSPVDFRADEPAQEDDHPWSGAWPDRPGSGGVDVESRVQQIPPRRRHYS